ncbi:MAG: radical SAM protein [Candidatus Aenigmarchaeota archaeon]|nr:radical SAM protein [Candidatus Aenigmarchaeota archaeon]
MRKNIQQILKKESIQSFLELDQESKNFYNEFEKILGKSEINILKNPEIDWKFIREKIHCVILAITGKCNSNCNVCYVKNDVFQEMSIEDIKNILKKIGKHKIVPLFGGEPTVRNDIFEIIRLIRDSGNIPELYTNGLKLADPEYVKKLKESGIARVHFSFDGFREEIHEKLRGDKNHLYLKLTALKNLQKFGIKTILSSTIADGVNDDQVLELLRFCALSVYKREFIIGLRLFPAMPYGKFDVDVKKYLHTLDIIKILEKRTGIRREYFVEFKKFLINMNRFLKKFGLRFPIQTPGPYAVFRVDRNGIKEVIELKDLKKINKALENYNIPLLLMFMLKNPSLFKHSIKLLNISKLREDASEAGFLQLSIGNVCTPVTYKGLTSDTVGIQKSNPRLTFSAESKGIEM